MKTIYIDGYFFNHEALGGISRMWVELIKNVIMLSGDIRFILSVDNKIKNVFIATLKDSIPKEETRLTIVKEKKYFISRSKTMDEFGPIRAWLNGKRLIDCNYGADLFHSSYMSTMWPKRKDVPTIITVHDLILQRFKSLFTNSLKRSIRYYQQLFTENFAIKNADYLIAVSQSSKNDLIDYFGFREDMISVIHHGISEQWFSCHDRVENNTEPYFLFVGGRNPYKNYDTVLKALAKLDGKYKEIQLITAGENLHSLEKERQRYRELKISKRVKDLGVVSDEKLKELYSNAVALVFPSIYEGFGFPLLESLACGCPVLASKIPTNKEIGNSLVTYFATKDSDCLADKMIGIYDNPPNECQREKYRNYANSYTWEAAAGKLLKLYQSFG